MPRSINVFIIEDDQDFAAMLQHVLEHDPAMHVKGIAKSEFEAMNEIRAGKINDCDCVLLDLQLPRHSGELSVNSLTGLRVIEELRHQQGYCGTIIVLTNSTAVADGQRALASGCDGYLCKRNSVSEIPQMLTRLRMAVKGEVILVDNAMRHVFLRDDISAKEARLLDLLTQGKSWTEVARELGYKTPKAAANVADRIFDKLLTPQDMEKISAEGSKKRLKALEIWNSRHLSHTPSQA